MPDQLIERLDRWLATNRPDYYALLQPGATAADLDAFEARFSVTLPDTFRRLYGWRNGQDPASSASLYGNRSFSCLADVADSKALLDDMIESDFEDPRWWRRGWVPFLHNGGGSHLCLDVDAVDGGRPGQLVAFWKADADRPVEFPSVDAWLNRLVANMENGTLKPA